MFQPINTNNEEPTETLQSISDLYEVHDFHGASTILAEKHPEQFKHLIQTLREFRFAKSEVVAGGGGKSSIAAALEAQFQNKGWEEKKYTLTVKYDGKDYEIDTHKIDCCFDRVILEIEWNNKDTFFDRDLSVFRMLHQKGLINCAVLITRSSALQQTFKAMVESDGLSKDKFVSTTTHVDRLIPRLAMGGAGECPVLVIGITDALITDQVPAPVDDLGDLFSWGSSQ